MDALIDVAVSNLINDGLISVNTQPASPEVRTIIATGVARSGTSMIAQLLRMAGLFMGHDLDEIVFEDHAITDAFTSTAADTLAQLVSLRDEHAKLWGFKRPHLFEHDAVRLQETFRNPHFIITFRDPVAVARRNGISEHVEIGKALREAAADAQRCLAFALELTCPVLMVSYEKALLRPVALVEELASFCGLNPSEECRGRMVAAIKANRDEYVHFARRIFQGYVDGISDGMLTGWCWQVGVPTPLTLEVRIGERPFVPVVADGFRPDLAAAEVGAGCHAFRLDVSELTLGSDERVTVRVQERRFQLSGSGQTVGALSGGALSR